MDPEVVRLPFNGYKRAIEKSALVGKAVPVEAPVKLQGFRLDKKESKIKMLKRLDNAYLIGGKEGDFETTTGEKMLSD